jgi:hypothetical protein
MGMLFARRRKDKVEGVTATENLLVKEPKKVESVQPKVKSVPIEPKQEKVVVENTTTTQPKFKI